ncbi:aminotransferase class III-fold pyridoxal phosphate-dependent enzyme [Sphingomonas sp. G124]|uniref:Aminotransferase class III-fold pyridoxal phosphate-dependent enzyme n=1 Tax=Sphingomonas cremea TaxID=2904799 RepID=A0A9X1QQ25_9SPHN|nr:aminotransferase class III-fold pyridoxal phosphate-dependent enzyme [Sphingomonas cremea]MCF2515913.1 aminotransferase class III-fold pyridoxal phosphate-dependent enzyme [Sphingomonas cremea]
MDLDSSERRDVLHSWCVQADWDAPTVVGGEGARFILADGRSILDLSSQAECSNLGHQHPRVVAAIREQAERLCYIANAWGAEPRAELARRLLDLSGFEGGRVFFSLGGADANEHAVKFARQAAAKPKGLILTRERSYHGASYMGMALSGDSRTNWQVDAEAMGVRHVQPPYAYRDQHEDEGDDEFGLRVADALGRCIDESGAGRVAAVLMEPDAGTNGMVAPDSYWPALRRHTAERDVLLIADEVMSGFGRCGEWFAWQRHGEAGRPDLMTLAKGLTGAAVPLGAVVMSSAVADRLEHEMLYAGLTYCGHPLACATGIAAIAAYEEEGLIERSRAMGAGLLSELERLKQRHLVIGDVRGGHGLFAVVELAADRATRAPLAPWPQQPQQLKALVDAALGEGVSLATRGNLILIAPPLVITEAELADALSLLDRLLARFFPPAK